MKRGSNRFAMSFRKAGTQEAYTPGSSSSSTSINSTGQGPSAGSSVPPVGGPPTSVPAKKKSRFGPPSGAAQPSASTSPQAAAKVAVENAQAR